MARRHLMHNFAAGDHAGPRELMAEIAAYAAEMNGHVDRENFAGAPIAGNKFATYSFNRFHYDFVTTLSGNPNMTIHAGEWAEIPTLGITWDTPCEEELEIDAHVSVERRLLDMRHAICAAVTLDGEHIGTDWQYSGNSRLHFAFCFPARARAGSHRMSIALHALHSSTTTPLDIDQAAILLREMRR